MKWLSLANNDLGGSIPSEMGRMTSLVALYLDGTRLQGKVPSELTAISSLRTVLLHNNNLEGSVENIFCKRGWDELITDCVDPVSVECSCCTECHSARLGEVLPNPSGNV